MKRNFLTMFAVLLTIGILANFNPALSQCSKEKMKEHNCSKEQTKDKDCSKEKKDETKATKEESKECAGDHTSIKINEIDKLHTAVAELWHKNYPAYNLMKMKKDTEKIAKMFSKLDGIKMPKGFENKEADYRKALSEFKTSVNSLKEYLKNIKSASDEDSE